MDVIWWGHEGLLEVAGDRIFDVPHFLRWKKITYFNIYLRFTKKFTGVIRTIFSHSLPIFRYSELV